MRALDFLNKYQLNFVIIVGYYPVIYQAIESEGINHMKCDNNFHINGLVCLSRYADCVKNMQVPTASLRACILLLVSLGIAIIAAYVFRAHIHHVRRAKSNARPHIAFTNPEINWHAIRHLW